ncbi:MAG: LuxR C-terminal-related transcriptional regulator [Gammaproteobacteria bacterium]
MVKILLRKDHITFNSGKDVAEICKPLDLLGITSFNFVKTYNDGSQINLSNIPSWLEHFFDNEYYHVGAFERHPSKYESGHALWPQLSGQKIFFDARTYFNIDNGITIIEKQTDSCDFYYFGTTAANTGIINFYLNNIDLLKRFILYFKDQARMIIKQANKDRIILPSHFEQHQFPEINEIYVMEKSRQDFLKATKIKNFSLGGELEGEVLSNKQVVSLMHLIEGKTAKEGAKNTGLSYRTVEGHINKLKERFNCNSKSELISKLLKNGLGIYTGNTNAIFETATAVR